MRPHGGGRGDKVTLHAPVTADAVALVTVKDRALSAPPPAEAAAAAAAVPAVKDGASSGFAAAAAASGGPPFAAALGSLPPCASAAAAADKASGGPPLVSAPGDPPCAFAATALGSLPPCTSMSQRTQYIVVSHKPQVFERAQCLVGVYGHRRTSLAATAYFDETSAGAEGGEAQHKTAVTHL